MKEIEDAGLELFELLGIEPNSPIEKALPIITVLTLAATGSEMNSGGVISNPETQDKIGRLLNLCCQRLHSLILQIHIL